jgi:hypothetical protein
MKYFINITCFNSLLSKYYNRCHGILKQDIIVILKQNNVIIEKDTRYYYFISLEDAENALFQIKFLYKIPS